jgi:signal transduction histidine kinase
MIDALPGTISWIASDLRYLGANRQLCDFLRIEPADIVGTEVGGIEKESGFRRFVQDFFASPKDKDSIELKARNSEVEKVFYLVARKYRQGTEALVLGMDITDYKKSVEELEDRKNQGVFTAKLAALGEVVASLSDEIQTPLLEIERTLSMLAENPQRTRSAIDSMQRRTTQVIQLTTLMNRFLADDHIESFSEITVGELVHDTLLLCTQRYALAGIDLRVGAFDPHTRLECQPTQILVILLNLLLNAYDVAKKLPEKWVRIEIALHPGGVDISVTDAGPGIPEDIRKRIFEPLFTTKQAGGGTGVGLSISRMVAEKHGGRLWIDSQCPNTRFVLSLPVSELKPA